MGYCAGAGLVACEYVIIYIFVSLISRILELAWLNGKKEAAASKSGLAADQNKTWRKHQNTTWNKWRNKTNNQQRNTKTRPWCQVFLNTRGLTWNAFVIFDIWLRGLKLIGDNAGKYRCAIWWLNHNISTFSPQHRWRCIHTPRVYHVLFVFQITNACYCALDIP